MRGADARCFELDGVLELGLLLKLDLPVDRQQAAKEIKNNR